MNDQTYLNQLYLLALRAAAAASPEETCLNFGVDLGFARWAAGLSLHEIENLATSDHVLFRPAHDLVFFRRVAAVSPANRNILLALAPAGGVQGTPATEPKRSSKSCKKKQSSPRC